VCVETAWRLLGFRGLWAGPKKGGEHPALSRGIQYVEHAEGHGDRLFAAACSLGLEGIVSKKLDAPYRSGPSKPWIRIKNQKESAATRVVDGTF
jgi:ATP-dependent DNA ligase